MESNSYDEYTVVTFTLFATIFTLMYYRRRRLNLPWESYSNKDKQRTNYNSGITYSSNEACISMLRKKKASFVGLWDLLKTKGLLYNTFHVSIEEQVYMFLHIVDHNERNRVMW